MNSIIAKVRAEGARDPRGQHHPVQRAADHRPRYQRRLRVPAARPAGRRSRRPRRRGPRADLRRQPGPAAHRRVHDLLGQHAPAVPRHRPRQGPDAGDQPGRRVQRAAGDARRLLRQRSQPVRPHLAAQPAGRAGGPRLDRRHLPDPRPQPERRHGAAAQLRRGAHHHRPAGDRALQQLPLGDHQRQPGARRQLGRGAGRDGAALGRDPAAGLQLRMDRHGAAGDPGGRPDHDDPRAGRAVRLPVPGGALRELDHPGAGAALGHRRHRRRHGGLVDQRARQQHLCPDRHRRADRAGRQERHPDRRVRQGAARARAVDPGCRGRGCPRAVPGGDDDQLRLHRRPDPAGVRHRGGDAVAARRRHGGVRRHDRGRRDRHLRDPAALCRSSGRARRSRARGGSKPRMRCRSRPPMLDRVLPAA